MKLMKIRITVLMIMKIILNHLLFHQLNLHHFFILLNMREFLNKPKTIKQMNIINK